ncbi:heme-dependent oxidative N-demethylase family protein [Ruegeria meonggei]|uniref:heme-dependent oxidative N-demethylase family protein n=1 Tax=Ruegeria meonggei TaxID=1446476 RepID=UPI00367081DF
MIRSTRVPLPGIQPTSMDNWLLRDDAFAAQMQRREALLANHRSDVLALDPEAEPAAQELLELVLTHAYGGVADQVTRPDGQTVLIDRSRPLDTLCKLVQEDLCILQKRGDEHVLTGAILCFPASWSLSEKFLRPLIDIHNPVDSYDINIARRVQRLFDGIQPGRPLWRFNALTYEDAELFQPRSANAPRRERNAQTAPYLRSERQTLLRLPETRAVIFSIHTYVLELEHLPKMENPA